MKKHLFFYLAAVVLLFSLGSTAFAQAPVFTSTPINKAAVGQVYTYTLEATNTPSFQMVKVPATMTLVGGKTLTWTPTDISQGQEIQVKAINGSGEATQTFILNISDQPICSSNIIGYWKMDETTVGTYADVLGINDGTLVSASSPTAAVGKVDGALEFGADSILIPDNHNTFDIADGASFSVELWVFPTGVVDAGKGVEVFIGRDDGAGTTHWWVGRTHEDRVGFYVRDVNGAAAESSSNTLLNIDQWNHVVCVFNNSTNRVHIYLNGAENNDPANLAAIEGTSGLTIGYHESGYYDYNGLLDEILIYNTALDAVTIGTHRTQGLAGTAQCYAGNFAPVITSANPPATTLEDALFSYTISATDVDGTTPFFTEVSLPSWLSFNPGTKVVSGTPLNDHVGPASFTLNVSDGDLDYDVTYNITVVNTNDLPVFTSTPVTSVDEEAHYTYTVTATDPDVGDAVTLSGITIPGWLTFNETTGELYGDPDDAEVGSHAVVIRATDENSGTKDQSFNIQVNAVNDAPVFTSTPVLTGDDYELYSYTITATDADGDNITLGADVLPAWLEIVSGVLTGTPDYSQIGDIPVSLTATDGTATTYQNFTIVVGNTNSLPVITSAAPAETADEDVLYSYTFTATDVDEDQTVTYVVVAKPAWLTFVEATGVLSGTPTNDDVGPHSVTLRAFDGTGYTDLTFPIQVINVNDPPVINGQNDLSMNQGESINILLADLDVTDVDNTAGELSVEVLDGQNYTYSGINVTPTASFSGLLEVNIKVHDLVSASETFVLEITVGPSGVKDFASDFYSIYPNPVRESFWIDFTKVDNYSVNIINLIGEVIYRKENIEEKTLQVNTLSFNNGIYFIKIMNENQLIGIQKIVIKK
ncbi:MAG: putative Ig domain-containing protein [Bacteroidales bacterium]|nr:putative Ig domain-containing protein [Bacteroidales bacterium]